MMRYNFTPFHFARVAWPNVGSTNFSVIKAISGAGDPIVGLTVHKVGRTTGRTTGQVTAVCVIELHASGPNRRMLCQTEADYTSNEGDSGAPVVELQADGFLVNRGLHWGGMTPTFPHTVFTPGNAWFLELNAAYGGYLNMTRATSPPPAVTIVSGPLVVPPGVHCSWVANATGHEPPFSYSWSGVLSGSGASIAGVVWASGALTVLVTDDVAHTDSDEVWITVDSSAPIPPDCFF